MALHSISLDGDWAFFYSPVKFEAGSSVLPDVKQYTGRIRTPGYWDDQYEGFDEEDFFGLTAKFNPDYRKPHFPMGRSLTPHAASSFLIGSGYYRKVITPEFEADSRTVLTVGPAMWGCSVFCNGHLAGTVTGYSTATDFDLTDLLESGRENEIIIVVCNVHDDGGAYCRVDGSHDGIPFGARPGQHRGLAAQGYQSERAGIGGGVTLHICGSSRIADWFVSCEDLVPHWHAELTNGIGTELYWSITDKNGETVTSGRIGCEQDRIDFLTPADLKYWSDRDPELYTLNLTLYRNGVVTDTVRQQWGIRKVTCAGPVLLVNGKPSYFRGVTEHCYFAETCNPHFDKAKYLRDLGVLKAAGFNFIRCHTWCPPEPFYDACDELGIYVQTELPSVYNFEEARHIIRMIRRHTCAVIFCEGNEKIICENAMIRLKKLVDMLHCMAPGMLFNPQEAMRGVEYGCVPPQKITMEPFQHDSERLAKVAEFSDLYGSLGEGYFSYSHDIFPGVEVQERIQSVYKKPCLSHEIGILGGYLDFELEKRYEGTFIGTDLFKAARENMTKHGVYENRKLYYERNCRFISSLRKQLVENIRACRNISGYDYLGGIDTHWHLIGYPCGVFNEFYEEKYGEPIADILKYNGESVLLCGTGYERNRTAGSRFTVPVQISYYGPETVSGVIRWSFESEDGKIAEGSNDFENLNPGTVCDLCTVDIMLPAYNNAKAALLTAEAEFAGTTIRNQWKYWIFPEGTGTETEYKNVRKTDELTEDVITFMEQGGAVLLTGNFPGTTMMENFRTHTSGRSLGHSGILPHPHPIWDRFPHEGFGDWQFYRLMRESTSLIRDDGMPEYQPVIELIPSFKLIKRKSPLTEYQVGQGRLMICGLRLDQTGDPACVWMQKILMDYLADPAQYANAPAWCANDLRKRLGVTVNANTGKRIDEGGRPIDD